MAFGDVVRLSSERASDPEADGFERFVGLEHIDPGDLRIRRWGDVAVGTTFTNVFRPGQVLFGKRRAYQRKVAIADFSGVCSGDIYVFEPKGKHLLAELLPFICQTDAFFEHAVGTSAGSLSPRTNWTSLAGFEFALPPIEEQRRIVAVLSAMEHVFRATSEVRDVLRSLEIAVADNWISGLQAKGVEPLPLASLTSSKPTYGLNAPAIAFSPDLPRYLRITDIDEDGQLSDAGAASVSVDEPTAYRVSAGDILFARTGNTVGKTYLVSGDEGDVVYAGYLIRFAVNSILVQPAYVFALTRSEAYRAWVRGKSRVGAQPNINASEYGELPVWLPADAREQSYLVERCETIRRSLIHVTSRLQRIVNLRRRLVASCLREVRSDVQ